MNDLDNAIQETIRIQKIKNKLDETQSMSEIADIVDSLNEIEAKKLLKLYIYSR